MNSSAVLARPSLNKIAVPIVGEFVLGISVAMAGLYLASHTSDSAASTFGLTQQVLETLFVAFRVLAIGAGILVTQSLGAGQTGQARDTAFTVLGASTWAGAAVALWLLLGDRWTLDVLNAPEELWPAASLYMALLAPSMLLEAYNLSMAAILRAHLHARESFWIAGGAVHARLGPLGRLGAQRLRRGLVGQPLHRAGSAFGFVASPHGFATPGIPLVAGIAAQLVAHAADWLARGGD
ncbi:MAG: multi anti extrusion protein MatE [Comamonadaceae bacterium]|nr:MAG: multi anti extrusion protein MatE [Comamonadaceae bacterium]